MESDERALVAAGTGGPEAAGAGIWCLHGAVGEAADWNGFCFSGHRAHAVDLWRFLECRPLTMAETGRALNAEARAVNGRRCLLGYSMGGRLALHALLERGHPWCAAVIVSAHPGLEDGQERAVRRREDAAWGAKAAGDWTKFLDAWREQPVLAGGADFDRRTLWLRRREVARSFIEWSLGAQEPLWERLREIEVPLLWVTGERDAKFTALGRRAAEAMPLVEHWVVEGTGHRVPWDSPGPFVRKVVEFLSGREFLEQSAV